MTYFLHEYHIIIIWIGALKKPHQHISGTHLFSLGAEPYRLKPTNLSKPKLDQTSSLTGSGVVQATQSDMWDPPKPHKDKLNEFYIPAPFLEPISQPSANG